MSLCWKMWGWEGAASVSELVLRCRWHQPRCSPRKPPSLGRWLCFADLPRSCSDRANLTMTHVELTGRAVAPGSGISCVYFKPDELGNLNSHRTQTWRAQPLDHRARHLTCQNTKQSLTYRHKPGVSISTNLKYQLLEGPIAAALT